MITRKWLVKYSSNGFDDSQVQSLRSDHRYMYRLYIHGPVLHICINNDCNSCNERGQLSSLNYLLSWNEFAYWTCLLRAVLNTTIAPNQKSQGFLILFDISLHRKLGWGHERQNILAVKSRRQITPPPSRYQFLSCPTLPCIEMFGFV